MLKENVSRNVKLNIRYIQTLIYRLFVAKVSYVVLISTSPLKRHATSSEAHADVGNIFKPPSSAGHDVMKTLQLHGDQISLWIQVVLMYILY